MKIKKLYTKYAQKSKIFLYPILGIKRGGSVTPVETYLEWVNKYTKQDRKLICLYHLRDDNEFKNFEKRVLLAHPKFENFYYTENNQGIYIFDYEPDKDLYDKVLQGKYSQIKKEYKEKILDFFSNNKGSMVYIDSYLNPEKYMADYANLLGVNLELIKSVGQLCELPDEDKEKCTEKEAQINLIDYI
jgi:hypothetical protein